jgi:hypothetical protein
MSCNFCAVCFTLLIGFGAIVLSGCGEDRGLVPVTGRVTFDSQPPPKPGRLQFGPIEAAAGFLQRPGMAMFDASGKFEVSSYEPGDGLTPGKYRVNVICVERDPAPVPGGFDAVTYVAPGYKPHEVVIAAGSKPITLAIDVPLKKRK